MLTNTEATDLMKEFIELKNNYKKTNSKEDLLKLQKHQARCVEKFSYLIFMRTARYKKFINYEDLNQEGYEALLKAMDNYNPDKGSFFWWGHKYIDTKISRMANLHTTIRYPLKVAKNMVPHREQVMPNIAESEYKTPFALCDSKQSKSIIDNACKFLSPEQLDIVKLSYGLNGDKPMSINKICKHYNISRTQCINILKLSLNKLKENINI